jgi:TM2 domain-containing membrane protein YozV
VRDGRDPFIALVLEVVGGFFGFLGIGWIYAGRPVMGISLLIGYWLLDWIIGITLSIITLGMWCLIWPAQNLIFGAISGYLAYRWLEQRSQY